MNMTHGWMSTAWMLGSSLLLNTSFVEAQGTVPADEYFAPQRFAVPVKRAPGLLPEALRNADSSKTDSSIRPIAPSDNSLSAGRKIQGMNPLATRPANRSAVTPATHLQNAPATTQGDAGPSPVQRQLEELYRKDGRPMPPMNFQHTPLPANGQVPNIHAGDRSVVAPSNVVPPKPRGLLDRLNPFSRTKNAPAPLPQHPANPIPNTAARPMPPQPGLAPRLNGIKPAGVNPATGATNTAVRPQPAPPGVVAVPAAAPAVPAAQPSANGSQLSDTLPPVPGDPGFPAASSARPETAVAPPAPASIDEALDNAFSDMPEANLEEQPAKEASVDAEAKPLENENPFSGLSLDEAFGPATKPAAEPKTADADAASNADSQSADAPASVSKGIQPTEIPLPPEAQPSEPAQDDVQAKMKLIAERGDLRGLKGFCPVALRDDRDLKNALPEHHSTFKGRTYYFSSADAKAAFDEHPEKYAPASGGQDVVLLHEKVTKEGSLDHAVWFKDRLYLFTSQKTLEQFVANPKDFAIHE